MRDVHIVDRAKINIERNNRVTGFDRYSFKVALYLSVWRCQNEVVKAAQAVLLGRYCVLKSKIEVWCITERKSIGHVLKTKSGVEIIVPTYRRFQATL